MPTFATPKPLTERITYALMQLRQARYDGRPECIHVAQLRLDDLHESCDGGQLAIPRMTTLGKPFSFGRLTTPQSAHADTDGDHANGRATTRRERPRRHGEGPTSGR